MTDGATTADTAHADRQDYVLRLFITGHTQKSMRAVRNITQLCEQHLAGAYDLEVIDVYQQPELAVEHQLVAAPALLKLLPLPPRKMVGDMSDTGRVLAGLGISQ
ncbi:MAG TPA: circadian clock KaiB family protein [Xanthobacteraceae bacterium]|jgi:circadian clock protein KaiB